MEGIKNHFIWSLQAMAVQAEEQVASSAPFVELAFEIIDDYDIWSMSFQKYFSNRLDPAVSRKIDELREMANSLSDDVYQSTNLKSMQQPEWDPLREKAKTILKSLSLPVEPPPQTIKGWWIFKSWNRP